MKALEVLAAATARDAVMTNRFRWRCSPHIESTPVLEQTWHNMATGMIDWKPVPIEVIPDE